MNLNRNSSIVYEWLKLAKLLNKILKNYVRYSLYHIVVKGGASSRYENVCKSSSTDVVEVVD